MLGPWWAWRRRPWRLRCLLAAAVASISAVFSTPTLCCSSAKSLSLGMMVVDIVFVLHRSVDRLVVLPLLYRLRCGFGLYCATGVTFTAPRGLVLRRCACVLCCGRRFTIPAVALRHVSLPPIVPYSRASWHCDMVHLRAQPRCCSVRCLLLCVRIDMCGACAGVRVHARRQLPPSPSRMYLSSPYEARPSKEES